MKLPKGFRAAGAAAGIKASGKPDLALIASQRPLRWALTTTTNALKAACVTRNLELFEAAAPVRAVVINSGNANCATGEQGERDNEAFAGAAATTLGVSSTEVLTASTGVIGERLPATRLRAALPEVAQRLDESADGLARAILTTDLTPKTAEATVGGARIVGIAKGSGMIHPDMATMFAFVLTDADLSQDTLRRLWQGAVAGSFNQVTVDGDTSPNDMAFLLADPRVSVDEEGFERGLGTICQDLARQIARDGEGATKLLSVRVRGARNDREARRAARSVVASPLVKSAAHGCDPNWGRILSAVGAARVALDLARLSIRVQGAEVYGGAPRPFDAAAVSASMNAEELVIDVDLAVGVGTGTAWGCDLSAEYVRVNADYHT